MKNSWLLLASVLSYFKSNAITFNLSPDETHCLKYLANKNTNLSIHYELLHDEDIGISHNIFYKQPKSEKSSTQNVVSISKSDNEKKINVSTVSPKDYSTFYEMCFANKNKKNVVLALFIFDQSVPTELAYVHQTKSLDTLSKELYAHSFELIKMQTLSVARARTHTDLLRVSHTRLIKWKISQLILIVVVSLLGVYYIEQLFMNGKSLL